ncbi:protease complex subunit PrcB family protein [Flavobacterium rhamnosiphilum]|uniref:Protease complex subunit PrcB family protein n=1 Tax=Flavobacterium rhamnosiphilum TaxID=2541724 RepID=A0A4R5FC11_9FLAO|nr:protease complex subunit PrcB family protein [Flavobacterium rhamnosiphilum]TDE46673.1 protease complex subunit PrcB family protein [Flavobacterium rhamnosiphilum]
MKPKISILFITIFIGLMTSCSKTDEDLNPLNLTAIGQNNLFGNGRENIVQQNFTISDSDSWNELLTKMNSVNNNSDGFTETNIDFANFMVIAVFDKVYGNGGHSIDIIKITETENKIIVTIDNVLKGNATAVMTQPYHIVKIRKTNKLILFE